MRLFVVSLAAAGLLAAATARVPMTVDLSAEGVQEGSVFRCGIDDGNSGATGVTRSKPPDSAAVRSETWQKNASANACALKSHSKPRWCLSLSLSGSLT